jgi:hypothetical protein
VAKSDVLTEGAEAYHAKDLKRFVDLYSPNVSFTVPGLGLQQGRGKAAAYWERIFEAFPDARARQVNSVTSGSTSASEWEITGTNSGPNRRPSGCVIPASHKPVRLRVSQWVRLEGDHVIEHKLFYDNAELANQLGVPLHETR